MLAVATDSVGATALYTRGIINKDRPIQSSRMLLNNESHAYVRRIAFVPFLDFVPGRYSRSYKEKKVKTCRETRCHRSDIYIYTREQTAGRKSLSSESMPRGGTRSDCLLLPLLGNQENATPFSALKLIGVSANASLVHYSRYIAFNYSCVCRKRPLR